jgi:sugar/nucleoside kinase (ribokinase family)
VKRLGVLGSMVWDTIHGRDPAQPVTEEWGGIAYSLAALDAALPDDWVIVPLIKVGRDLAGRAHGFLRSLTHLTPDTRFIEVPQANNRVTLRYEDEERRCEHMEGGVPPWTWPELGPLVADLDALYLNFISGFELDLGTARLLRRGFPRFMYADLHSLFLGKAPDGRRFPQPLPHAAEWFACFDVVQVNEQEMAQLGAGGGGPAGTVAGQLVTAAAALDAGCRALCVTLGARGAVYFERAAGGPIRTARVAVGPEERAPATGGDSTGCGDVFGGVAAAALLGGVPLEDALRRAARFAARNVTHRGATGLRDHLLGRLSGV